MVYGMYTYEVVLCALMMRYCKHDNAVNRHLSLTPPAFQ